MEVAELNQLETQIESLLQSIQRLKFENIGLQQQVKNITLERNKLLKKQEKASEQVRRIIGQLKEEIGE